MQELSYAAFSASVHRQTRGSRTPLHATFELTRRCPLACRHCYNNLPVGDRQAARAELSSDEHRRILDELAELGGLWVLYTGGEILARKDFLEIYEHARARGFLITLFTNATSVTPALAAHLGRARPFAVEVTLYGATRATYEEVTGIPGSYQRCLRGIRLLRDQGIPLSLKTVALTLNRHELDGMAALAGEQGLPFKFDALISPRLDCSQSPLQVRLTPEQCVGLDLDDPIRARDWRAFGREAAGTSGDPERLYQCGGGVNSLAIDPYGRLSLCVLSEREKFDLRTGTLREGWEQFLGAVRARPPARPTKCTSCGLRAMCGMCPANGELEAGDPEKPVEFLCQVAHLRALTLGLPIRAHGDCAYCTGGESHDEMLGTAERLRKGRADAGAAASNHREDEQQSFAMRPTRLAVLPAEGESSCGSGGCAACR